MKNHRATALALAVCFCFTLAARAQSVTVKAPPEMDARNWKEYAPPGEGFSVLMPGAPRKQTQQRPLPDGDTMTVHIHALTTPFEYVVMYNDFPLAAGDPRAAKQILDAGAQGAAEPGKRELLHVKEIALDTHPGREIKVKLSNGAIGRARIYLVGSRLYQAIIVTPSETDAPNFAIEFNEETAAKFLDSFKLTGTPAQTTSSEPPPMPARPAEGEVDRMMKELAAKNEPVYTLCDDLEQCRPKAGGPKAVIEPSQPLNKPAPLYPPIAKAARAQGTVVVYLIVDEEGKVIAAQAQSGHPLLKQAAVKAAREARFTPTLLDGKPVKIAGLITYNFVLQ